MASFPISWNASEVCFLSRANAAGHQDKKSRFKELAQSYKKKSTSLRLSSLGVTMKKLSDFCSQSNKDWTLKSIAGIFQLTQT